MIDSSSPSPSPVRLSPVCCTEPSLLRSCWNQTASTRLPPPSKSSAEASRSIDCDREPNSPRFFTASQPSPIRTRLRPPPPRLVSETCWPLLRLTPIVLPGRGALCRQALCHQALCHQALCHQALRRQALCSFSAASSSAVLCVSMP